MTKQQFRFLVIANQLLLLTAYIVRDLTDVNLPPELQEYLVTGESVMDAADTGLFSEQNLFALWVLIDITGLAGAVGLCFGRRWARTLYLGCYVSSLFAGLLTPFYFSANWPAFVFVLYGTTEGMILALAYFSHLRRMFRRDEPEDGGATAGEAAASA